MISELYSKVMDEHREGISYVFFGGLTTVVTWLTYALFVWLSIDINISNVLSWICGVSFAYVVNKWFVFLSKSLAPKTIIREFASFIGARILTGVIAFVLFPILYGIGINQMLFGVDGLWAKIITSIIEIVLNWVLSKYIVFRKNANE